MDPITLAVVRNNLISIAKGMQETAYRSGVTTFMYEIGDCSFAILDADAGVIAQSHGMLLFLGSLFLIGKRVQFHRTKNSWVNTSARINAGYTK